MGKTSERIGDLLRAPAGAVDLDAIDTRATPGFDGKKADAERQLPELGKRLETLQEQLYANGRTGGRQRVLIILQGVDTSGKGGTVKHVVGAVDPAGVRVVAFRSPTPEERRHDFLWRIRKQLPEPGVIAAFDRSHYEDVVAVRVRKLADRRTWSRRYATINEFEERLAADGAVVVKCFLHISPEEQRERLLARLDDPTKHWKYRPGDLEDRALWGDFQRAYGDAIERCGTDAAPWYVVPADRKWYRNWAVARLLAERLEELGLGWPAATFDVEEQKKLLLASAPGAPRGRSPRDP
jgi:PPK2 family polyphosphate:nucleotide phosphotransferase